MPINVTKNWLLGENSNTGLTGVGGGVGFFVNTFVLDGDGDGDGDGDEVLDPFINTLVLDPPSNS